MKSNVIPLSRLVAPKSPKSCLNRRSKAFAIRLIQRIYSIDLIFSDTYDLVLLVFDNRCNCGCDLFQYFITNDSDTPQEPFRCQGAHLQNIESGEFNQSIPVIRINSKMPKMVGKARL